MKILLTVNAAWNLWNFRRALIDDLLEQGHETTALVPVDETASSIEKSGVRIIPLHMDKKGTSPLKEVSLLWSLWRHFRREHPDIILSFTIKNNIYGAIAARLLGIPFIPNITGLGSAFLGSSRLRKLVSLLYRQALHPLPIVFFQNTDDRDLFIRKGIIKLEQSRILPGSGIDLTHFLPAPLPAEREDPLTFLLVARLLRDKGIYEFVEAARGIQKNHPAKCRFRILGPAGSENPSAIPDSALQSWIREGVIEYLGTTNDVRPHLAQADCIVLPSYREGTPRTLLEGAAMARPLIATDVPGCRNVVEHGRTGFLCKVKDAESLQKAMERLLALPRHERVSMGLRSREKMERQFDQAFIVQAYRNAISILCPGTI